MIGTENQRLELTSIAFDAINSTYGIYVACEDEAAMKRTRAYIYSIIREKKLSLRVIQSRTVKFTLIVVNPDSEFFNTIATQNEERTEDE